MKTKKNIVILLNIIIIIFFLFTETFVFKIKNSEARKINKEEIINQHYYKFAKTNKEAFLYDKKENIIGKIGNNIELSLKYTDISGNTKYFEINDLKGDYYVKYEDVDKIDNLTEVNKRYKNYILFNENVITKDLVSFYDQNGNLVYKFYKKLEMPIIIKDDDKYGVEFSNRLLYINKEDIEGLRENNNTDQNNTNGIGVLNYHFVYRNSEETCSEIICHPEEQFRSQLDYIKENKILTLKMKEVEMYIDGKIRLPRSVLITIDDGGRTKLAVDILTEYKMYATIFLITSWYNPKEYYTTEYIELHSHSHNMHNYGDCPIGQGGGIQCLSEEKIQNDLRESRKSLNNTTYFCYPFYEYNDYSIEMLKKAGFTMAFIGEGINNDNLIHVNSDKFKLHRFVVVTYTTLNDFDKYLKQIK